MACQKPSELLLSDYRTLEKRKAQPPPFRQEPNLPLKLCTSNTKVKAFEVKVSYNNEKRKR